MATTHPHVDLVRPSRDGDQFHYAWAARRTLAMLPPDAALVAVSIEGVTPGEGEQVSAGLDAIDVAEYVGSTDLASAARVTYLQLKHSTRQANEPWQVSGLRPTISKFAERYVALVSRFGCEDVAARFFFGFETNRPIAQTVTDAIAAIADDEPGAEETSFAKATGLTGDILCGFVAQFTLRAHTPDYLEQRRLLSTDLSAYLPDNDRDTPLQLRDLVTRKATSEFARNPVITRHDVLHAIGVTGDELYPAPSLIEAPTTVVEREQLSTLVAQIVTEPSPVIVQADGGVGKSVVATRIGEHMPPGSVTLVYDCFGNGAYRSLTGRRHQPREGLVQFANELAALRLCDPLVPTVKADTKAYARAFASRVEQASASLEERAAGALLCLVIDAADNAETEAREAGDHASFARLLLREPLPDNVRLVLTSRTHRVPLLDPPPEARRIDLLPFSLAETAKNLRAVYPAASERDVEEFHRLTSSNPRVQATALASADDLRSVLAGLGPEPLTVQDTIAHLLTAAIAKARDDAPKLEQPQVDRVCEALATLRPFVPLAVVARTAGVSESLVASLASDLGRPLLIRDGAVQFRDEPTETWFRERFRPSAANLAEFVDRLLPLASTSAYVAATLPQLMLEAGRFDALVRLTLEGDALPQDDPVARRDVELQRLRFALQAALRDRQYEAAAKLCLKAGGEVAAGDRQEKLIGANTDLGASFLDTERMAEQVSRRQIGGGGWTGSEHAFESAFLSGNPTLAGDARSRLRIAHGWLAHWNRSKDKNGERPEQVEVADIAELALAELNLHGARVSARHLRRWRPRDLSFGAGRILTKRLIDAARFGDVNALAEAAGNDIGLLLAIALELAEVGRAPPPAVVRRALALTERLHGKLEVDNGWHGGEPLIAAVTALVSAAARHRLRPRRTLAGILGRYLPAQPSRALSGDGSSFGEARTDLLRAYALRAAMAGRELRLHSLASPEIRKALTGKHLHHEQAQRFRENVGALLPWARLWANVTLGRVPSADVGQKLAEALAASARAEGVSYREESATADEVAAWRGNIILATGAGATQWAAFDTWRGKLRKPLFIPTLLGLARRAARTAGEESRALDLARAAFDLADGEREDAELKTDTLIRIARAILPVSAPEARTLFDKAVEASGRIGSENLARWQAVLHLGGVAAQDGGDDPVLAYRLARAAELTYHYVVRDKHFEWEHTAETLVDLSPSSALAILSRWLDRLFGREARLLPVMVDRLTARSQLDPRTALALLPMKCWWKPDRLLEAALAAEPGCDRQAILSNFLMQYQRFSTDAKRLRGVNAAIQANGIDLPEAGDALRRAELIEASNPSNLGKRWVPTVKETARDWDGIFAGLSLTSASDLAAATARFRSGESPYWTEEFNREAIARVRAGNEAAFLDAFGSNPSLDLLDVRGLLEALPGTWTQRLSVRPAVQRLLRTVCRQDAASVSADRHYERLPWTRVLEVSGLGTRELMGEAIEAIAATAVPHDADGLFRLAGILSHQLDAGQAGAALRFGLDLFEPSLEPSDGDGPWSPQLSPPPSVEASVAGYLWAALASPVAERRWEAAHAVRGLCRLRRDAVLQALIAMADTGEAGAFADSALRFYDRHGLLWLLIALARAAEESGPAVATHAAFLRRHARRDHPHVLQRGFAARALLSLGAQRLVDVSEAEAEALRTVNVSRLPPLGKERRTFRGTGLLRGYDENRFSFGIDIGPYWLAPLGRAFGLDVVRIEEAAEKVIRRDWGLGDNGRWDRDERARRRYFDRATRHSHGSTPEVDDLQFYLSYHAMMTVAGKLLETEPAVPASDDGWSSFPEWLRGHDLSRHDGLWLADRRDPPPLDVSALPPSEDADWPGSVHVDEAFGLLTRPDGALVVSGYWTSYSGEREQVVSVSSALASPGRSEALVRALKTAGDPQDYKVPEFGDSLEIDQLGFMFKGWVQDGSDERALDEHDGWAAGIGPRVPAPAAPFASDLHLAPDKGGRVWTDGIGRPQLRAQTWSEGTGNEDGDRKGQGRRLIATPELLEALMRSTKLDLIVRVTLQRKLVKSRYAREREGEIARKVTEIVLLRPGHEPWRVSFDPRSRPGAGRRTRTRRVH